MLRVAGATHNKWRRPRWGACRTEPGAKCVAASRAVRADAQAAGATGARLRWAPTSTVTLARPASLSRASLRAGTRGESHSANLLARRRQTQSRSAAIAYVNLEK